MSNLLTDERIFALYNEHEEYLAGGTYLFHFNSFARDIEKEVSAKPVDIARLVDRFLSWPVPASVYPDGTPGKPGRTGTNLLSATEAQAMLEYVLAAKSDGGTQ